jgi:hypothetical protein
MPGPGRRTIWLWTTVPTGACGIARVIGVALEAAGQRAPDQASDAGDEDAPACH